MRRDKVVEALSFAMPRTLAEDLFDDFLTIRQDVATGTLGRSAPGKFVETLVQVLQHVETETHEVRPDVDGYLRALESRNAPLPDGLKVCAARIGRAMYTLRNKRSIAHKGEVDPNQYDLHFILGAAQWVLAELVRSTQGLTMEESGKLVAQIQAPVGGLVQDFGQRRIVLLKVPVRTEILVLLHSYYPDTVTTDRIVASLDRHPARSVRHRLAELWKEKMIEGTGDTSYCLTQRGFQEAISLVRRLME